MLREGIRRFSTRSFIDQLLNIAQLPLKDDTTIRLTQLIKTYAQQKETVDSNLIHDVINRWAIEQPKKVALCSAESNKDQYKTISFADLSTQSSRLANVLTGKDFDLTPGQTVLAILPNSAPEHIFLQLACSQSGLVYSPYNPEKFTNAGITERIQKLAVGCVITSEDHLEKVVEYTHNPLRPLKKGLITNCPTSQPLPIGWHHLIQRIADAKSEHLQKRSPSQSHTPILRVLSNNNQMIEYSQKHINLHHLLGSLWLNLEKSSQLLWMKNSNETISIAPWLFGTTIFLKAAKDLQTLFETFEHHPIDTFCSSSESYQLLMDEQPKMSTHLTQLLSTEPVDHQSIKRWHSITNLPIRDNYTEFNNLSVFESSSSNVKREDPCDDIRFYLGERIIPQTISLKKLLHQDSNNKKQIQEKVSQI